MEYRLVILLYCDLQSALCFRLYTFYPQTCLPDAASEGGNRFLLPSFQGPGAKMMEGSDPQHRTQWGGASWEVDMFIHF